MIPDMPQQGPMYHVAHRRGANEPEVAPSAGSPPPARNASAPGQVAKAMIAEATANGAELPANIQGKAASAIARGMNMETFFASFMPAVELPAGDAAGDVAGDGESLPPDEAGDGAIPEPGSEIPAPESGAAALPAPASDGETTVSLNSAAAGSYEIASTLLEPLAEPESKSVV